MSDKDSDNKRSWVIPIAVAAIPVVGTIVVALINKPQQPPPSTQTNTNDTPVSKSTTAPTLKPSSLSSILFSSSNSSLKLDSNFGWQPGGSEANSYQLLSQNALILIAGAETDYWQGTDSAPLISYRVRGDFDVRVQVEISPRKNFQLAGIGVRSISDSNTFVRVSRHKLGDQHSVGVGANRQGIGIPALGNANYAKSQIFLRVVRQGSSFDLYYSDNNTNWVALTKDFVIGMSDEAEVYLFVISVDKQEGIKATFSDLEIGSM
jgi:regulation of enolase protein 1 (concanavalin A-like superfamily)